MRHLRAPILFPAVLALSALVAGCNHRPAPPLPTLEVLVPVATPCVSDPVPQPAYPADRARAGMSASELARIAVAERLVRQAETERLRAAEQACR